MTENTSKSVTIELEKIGGSKPWVARITGTDPKYGFARHFEAGLADYSRSNRPGTRGITYAYTLDEGHLYEVSDPRAWGRTERYFCTVRDGELTKLSATEVRAAIRQSSEPAPVDAGELLMVD